MARLPAVLLSMALLAALARPGWANNPPPDEENDQRAGGNAIDNATQKPAAPATPPPGYYDVMGDFWGAFLAGGNPTDVAGKMFWGPSPEELPPTSSADLYILPIDGPAESILDQIDESQAGLVLVGMPGSAQETGGAAGAVTGTQSAPAPLPEGSFLDQIDATPTPPNPPVNRDPITPAANQAPAPQIVEVKGK